MAEKTIRVCDRCGRMPARTVKVIVVEEDETVAQNGIEETEDVLLDVVADRCTRCASTTASRIRRAMTEELASVDEKPIGEEAGNDNATE